jgi:hypothetical protein
MMVYSSIPGIKLNRDPVLVQDYQILALTSKMFSDKSPAGY